MGWRLKVNLLFLCGGRLFIILSKFLKGIGGLFFVRVFFVVFIKNLFKELGLNLIMFWFGFSILWIMF